MVFLFVFHFEGRHYYAQSRRTFNGLQTAYHVFQLEPDLIRRFGAKSLYWTHSPSSKQFGYSIPLEPDTQYFYLCIRDGLYNYLSGIDN